MFRYNGFYLVYYEYTKYNNPKINSVGSFLAQINCYKSVVEIHIHNFVFITTSIVTSFQVYFFFNKIVRN